MLKIPASLQGRLLLMVLGTSLCVWLAAALVAWKDAQHELHELLDGHLAQAAALLVVQQAHRIEHGEQEDAPSVHRYAPRVVFQVFHQGRLVLRSANAPLEPMLDGGTGPVTGFHDVTRESMAWRVFATRGAENDVLVLVGERQRARTAILRAVQRGVFWPMALALPLLALAGWAAVRSGLRPLRTLGSTLAARGPEELQAVELADAPEEMRPMVDALNQLFVRIAGLIEGERRFTGDAAHELRTPIAAIRMQAQVALGAVDAQQRRHALEATVAGCDRATRLVDQLLTLTRLEAEGQAARRPLELGALVRRVLVELAPAALAKQQEVRLDADPSCRIEGDETLLAALCRNLVDNAIRYSPPRARIQVRLEAREGAVLLSVDDSGPGLEETQLARLGQRFFRVAGHEAPGSGLGWSIVRRIAAAHGCTLEAKRSPVLGGLRVEALFPRGKVLPVDFALPEAAFS
jgi:two-component system sensor histidine kinase QseC